MSVININKFSYIIVFNTGREFKTQTKSLRLQGAECAVENVYDKIISPQFFPTTSIAQKL